MSHGASTPGTTTEEEKDLDPRYYVEAKIDGTYLVVITPQHTAMLRLESAIPHPRIGAKAVDDLRRFLQTQPNGGRP